jgi:hypothetical protein
MEFGGSITQSTHYDHPTFGEMSHGIDHWQMPAAVLHDVLQKRGSGATYPMSSIWRNHMKPRIPNLTIVALIASVLILPVCAKSPQDGVWTRIDRLTPFEARAFKQTGAPVPDSIRRYFRNDPLGGQAENFENDAVYARTDGFIQGEYIYASARFRGTEDNFSMEYDYSVGSALSAEGSLWIIGTDRIQTNFDYSTSGSTLVITRNGAVILKRRNPKRLTYGP